MTAEANVKQSVRLPVFLIIGFLIGVGAVAIWLALSEPDSVSKETIEIQRHETKTANNKVDLIPNKQTKSTPLLEVKNAPKVIKPMGTQAQVPKKLGTTIDKLNSTHSKELWLSSHVKEREKSEKASSIDNEKNELKKKFKSKENPPIIPKKDINRYKKQHNILAKIKNKKSKPKIKDTKPPQVTSFHGFPKVNNEWNKPYKIYARPFNFSDKRPRVGIVVTGLGQSNAATETAIQSLPGSITLAFAPYSSQLNEWIKLARTAGHEVLITIPMEPNNYPSYNPGPQTLLTTLSKKRNLERLLWSLERAAGYVGIVDYFGSRFTASREHLTPVLKELKHRGLLYLDSGSSPLSVTRVISEEIGIPAAKTSIILDKTASRLNIDQKLRELERQARLKNVAIGIASPFPVTLERIMAWSRKLRARGIAIAPISALVKKPNDTNTI